MSFCHGCGNPSGCVRRDLAGSHGPSQSRLRSVAYSHETTPSVNTSLGGLAREAKKLQFWLAQFSG